MKKASKKTVSENTIGKLEAEKDELKQKPPSHPNLTQKEIILNQLLQSLSRHIATNFIAKNSFVKLQFRNSNSYFGWLSSNGLNGFGTYSFKSGAYFKGTFEESISKGIGSLTYTNGDNYEGEFLAGLPHGYGHYKSERFKYTGYFKNGKFHGNGNLKKRSRDYFTWEKFRVEKLAIKVGPSMEHLTNWQ
ncbi:uncharacterized protein LOC129951635 isoform X2 [Eupeodes corollae]|uniref:uncharacterized protein LOC129951635 isoform X2 n=1 Tax=Eupeodes corollae TaxID=290404 RepID=UPI0024926E14|nr:uncharacterized protein LOC129951635 isoform X2 [Eupeodes corollae]